jgi:hypothetical protein
MTQEDKKQVASQTYALENFTDIAHLTKLRNAWLAGYEASIPKWIKEVTLKPDNDRMVLIKIKDYRRPEENVTETSLGYYDKEWYYSHTDNLVNSGHGWFIEEWLEIPQ